MPRSLRIRLVAVAVIWVTVALLAAGTAIASLLHDFVARTFDSRLEATLLSVLSAIEADDEGVLALTREAGEPQFDQLLSGWYWQVADGERIVLRSRSLFDADIGVGVGTPDGEIRRSLLEGPAGTELRALQLDFTEPGSAENLRLTVAGPSAEISTAFDTILPPLSWSLLALGAGLVGAVLLQVHFGLKPLDQVQRNLAHVRAGSLERLPAERHAEIAPLVGEINALIDHNSAVIERARTHAGNLAHSLKTPLSALNNEIAREGRDPNGVLAECVARMQRLIKYHLRRARMAAAHDVLHAPTPIGAVVDDIVSVMRRLDGDGRTRFSVACAAGLTIACERQDLEEMIGNIVDNACKWAASEVRVACRRAKASVVIEVSDDGPGMPPEDMDRALRRGTRLDETMPGSGLGLAIVRDLAALYGGSLEIATGPIGGLSVFLSLPAAGSGKPMEAGKAIADARTSR